MVKLILTDEQWNTIRVALIHEKRKQEREENQTAVDLLIDALTRVLNGEEV